MKEGGLLVYKCRACGVLHRSTHVLNIRLALARIEDYLFDVHTCAADKAGPASQIGVSDLIGGERDA